MIYMKDGPGAADILQDIHRREKKNLLEPNTKFIYKHFCRGLNISTVFRKYNYYANSGKTIFLETLTAIC